MKASILAVGTEITTGQIINQNASWISQKLIPLGLKIPFHLTVPDDRTLILKALDFLAKDSEWLFVTGGLGPTSDDFTRDLISQWSGQDLKFHEPSWEYVQRRLSSRGYPVRESQKQQCFFPEGSLVLENANGTANGFYLKVETPTNSLHVFVLPGPPKEIEGLWNDRLLEIISPLAENLIKTITKSWDTLGVGESEVAHIVEGFAQKFPHKDKLEIGYRVHLPYVEVKISYTANNGLLVNPLVQDIDRALAHITVAKDFVDLAQITSQLLKDIDFTFYDYITGGLLHRRLQPFLKNHSRWSWKQSPDAPFADLFEGEENFMALLPHDDGRKMLFIYDYFHPQAIPC